MQHLLKINIFSAFWGCLFAPVWQQAVIQQQGQVLRQGMHCLDPHAHAPLAFL
jgi:hypothetical protein